MVMSELNSELQVITYDPRYVSAFADLNREWIETHFEIEPMDTYQLDHPSESILSKNGEIFFVLSTDAEGHKTAVGTCAMVPYAPKNGEKTYELAKMAVSPKIRGKGLGNVLIQTAIDWAREQNAGRILLHSNTKLEPAIKLYKKHGFQTDHLGKHPDYERCNIEMSLKL